MITGRPLLVVRFKLALHDAHSDRATRTQPIEGDVYHYRRHGFSEAEFWATALAETMPAPKFVDMIVGYFCPWSADANGRQFVRMILNKVIVEAFDAKHDWVFLSGRERGFTGVQSLHLNPRLAAEWLAKPMREHLLPNGLKAFLACGEGAETTVVELSKRQPRKRGPRPKVMPRVVDAMRAMDRDLLNSLTEAAMASHFDASADTCRKARDIITEGNETTIVN